ncbi:unnamed protein product [Linum tenue]|uniref:FPL domain-containing protein n=1 Tax=Linum tenue TaxID=586396 RepID=A0AAV0NVG3_9ROSI|nr:unnamed protein product [Linum tenue]
MYCYSLVVFSLGIRRSILCPAFPDLVVDIVQSIVEIVSCGDSQDPQLFERFMEYQVLAEFVRVLRICTDTGIQAPFLQYLSIFIQNIENYCFSNDHINNIIAHPFNFGCGDLDPYYISFLRAVSSKVNIGIISILVKVHGVRYCSFLPVTLYSAALKFSQRSERMIQAAVRAITLNLYKVSDDLVLQFLSTPPVSDYFSNLVWRLKEQCSHLDGHVHALKERFTDHGWKELLLEADKIVDEIYYLKDIISVGESCLSEAVALSLVNFLIFPILGRLLKTQQSDVSCLLPNFFCSYIYSYFSQG